MSRKTPSARELVNKSAEHCTGCSVHHFYGTIALGGRLPATAVSFERCFFPSQLHGVSLDGCQSEKNYITEIDKSVQEARRNMNGLHKILVKIE